MQNKANQTDQTASNNRGEDIRKDLLEEICSIWLGWRDSNPRMPGPKPGALPLGHIPLFSLLLHLAIQPTDKVLVQDHI